MTFTIPVLATDPRKLPDDPATWSPQQHDAFEAWARDVRRAEIHRASHRPTPPRPFYYGPSLDSIRDPARKAWAEYKVASEAVAAFRVRVDQADARAEKAQSEMATATGTTVLAAADAQQAAVEAQAATRRTFADLEARHTRALEAANKSLGALGAAAQIVIASEHRIAALRKALAGDTGGWPKDTIQADLQTAERKLDALLCGEQWPVVDGREEDVVLVENEHGHPQPWEVRGRAPRVHRLALNRVLFGQLSTDVVMGTARIEEYGHDPSLPLAVRLADLEG